MKITVLIGSPRKKDCFKICKLIEKNFSQTSDTEFEYLFLKEFHIEDCRGCDQCFQKGEQYCPCSDDLDIVKKKLLNADGIIFASPVYACQITGLMKRVFDRLSYLFHRQELIGKPVLTVVSTGGGGQKPAGQYLKMTACGWGGHFVGNINVVSPMYFENYYSQSFRYNRKYHDSVDLKVQKAAACLENAIVDKNLKVPSFYDIFMFQCLRSKTFVSKADYAFWEEKGWLSSNYFYPVKMNPVKVLFSRMIRAYVNAATQKIVNVQDHREVKK